MQSLDVSHNYLNGQLTMDFTPMTALTQLVMSFNNINGGLPPSLGNLAQVCAKPHNSLDTIEKERYDFAEISLQGLAEQEAPYELGDMKCSMRMQMLHMPVNTHVPEAENPSILA